MALKPSQESKKLFKHYLGSSDSKERREFFEEPINSSFTITPGQLWTYGDKIPTGQGAIDVGIPSLDDGGVYSWQKSESELIPIVKRFKDFKFSAIDAGTDNAFVLKDGKGDPIQHIIPFNFSDDTYNYTLKTGAGKRIAFGVGDWVFDQFSGVLTFYGTVPSGVDHLNPPLFSFFQYVGDLGFRQDRLGLDGVVLPLEGIEVAAGSAVVSNPGLTAKIIAKASEVEDGFTAKYGWDGADKNEGIALSFESLVPVIYASSKDPIKGYDDSSNAEISAVISRIHAVQTSSTYATSPVEISFVNENAAISANGAPIDYAVTISGRNATLSKAGVTGATVSIGDGPVMLRCADEKTYVVLSKVSDVADMTGRIAFTLERRDDAVLAMLYWSSTKKQYWPFASKEAAMVNTGFPVSVANGKIPPSLAIGSIPLSGYSDIITPDYYGPRVHNVVIAQEGGHQVKSADYIVKNSAGYFLDDVLKVVLAENPGLTGVVYLRNGEYQVNSHSLDLSKFRDVAIVGECSAKTVILGPDDATPLTVSFTDDSALQACGFALKHVTLKNSAVVMASTSGKTFVVDDVVGVNGSFLFVKNRVPTLLMRNSSFDAVTLSSPDAITEDTKKSLDFDSMTTLVYDSSFNTMSVGIQGTSIRGVYANVVSLDNGSVFFRENTVKTLASKATGAIVQGCSIQTYGAQVAKDEYPSKYATGSIPIFGAMGYNYQKYVNLADPLEYDEATGLIKVKLDSEVLEINKDGQLTTCLTSDRINVGALEFDQYALDDNLDESTRRKFDGGTLTAALALLAKYKADLINGKVPLRQLPDAVAYGGLLYKGVWCFEEKAGKYPTSADLVKQGADDDFTKETYIEALQPGWFVIVAPSAVDVAANNPVHDQPAEDGVTYTAGDWCVYNGKGWEKLDKAYQDACYAILAANDPDGNPWYWKQTGSTGWLDFKNVTIYEAFHRINDLFTSLIPKRPASINDASIALALKTKLTEYLIKKIGNDGSTSPAKAAFNVNEPGAKRIVIGTPPATDRKGLIYYGDTATMAASIDGTVVGSVDLDVKKNNVSTSGALHVTRDADPYADADYGSGFWKGVEVDIVPTTDVSDLGQHQYALAVDAALPASITSIANGMKSKSYDLFLPYVPSSLAVGETTFTDFDPALPGAKTMANACSGIYKLPGSFTVTLSTVLLKAFYDYVKDAELAYIKNSITDTYEPLLGYAIDKTNEGDPADRFFDLVVNNYVKSFSVGRVYESVGFTVKLKGTLEGADIETLVATVQTRIDPVSEIERVTSGLCDYVYPVYNNNSAVKLNQCGKAFSSSTQLTGGFYVSELMKIGRNRTNADGSYRDTVFEYKWPAGKYQYLKDSFVDYSACAGLVLNQGFLKADEDRPWAKTGEFRWVTFEKFLRDDGSFTEEILDEASGFTVDVKAADDRIGALVIDDLTGSTEGMLIYAKVLGIDEISQSYLSDSELLNSGWIDCNKAYDGFSTPYGDGDPAMYAGSSTASSKRVTFGRTVRSGKLIVRVGITKASGIEILGVNVRGEI